MSKTASKPKLEEVFKLSGIPTYTFVAPTEYARLLVALRTPGRGVVIEGPSGIGKTTAVAKAIEELIEGKDALMLSARRREDRDVIAELPNMTSLGLVVIDDFHRLDDDIRAQIADQLKLLADEEDETTKIVILGINRAGESLIHFARDLTGRLDVIRFEANPDDRVRQLVTEGAAALNVELPTADIVKASHGSFHIAQLLSHSACLTSDIHEWQKSQAVVKKSFSVILERVVEDLSMAFMEAAMKFASGPSLSPAGRAPYLHALQWLSESSEAHINLVSAMRKRPDMRASVQQIVDRGHLANFLSKNEDLGALIHFDSRTSVLAVEDPKFFFFIKNLTWAKFAERVGYLNVGFTTKYDFALSFAGAQRELAAMIYEALAAKEYAVFYDANEQSRILAVDIEEYLAPIYQSEASFVICLLSPEYPARIWTKFESRQFASRFGAESVIPVWFKGAEPGVFDKAASVGGYFYDPLKAMDDQVDYLVELLQEKLAEHRLLPPLGPDEFHCRQCALILNVSLLASGRVALCTDCAEKFRIA